MAPRAVTPFRMTTSTTVRDATIEVMRTQGLTRIFANPGSTEISFLVDLPDDFSFVLALHEGSVVGMATGLAIAQQRPAFVNLHTTAGLGNAVGAIATARVNRAPLVIVVGQQDRRHLALQPFLAGDLIGLAGEYPVWFEQPARAQDVPGAVQRASHEAASRRGPAIVVVPMDDWRAPMGEDVTLAAPAEVLRAGSDAREAAERIAAMIDRAASPAIVVGAGADDAATWAALERIAEILRAPVWQESFGGRAGFRQDHPQFAGHLPANRTSLRERLTGHDAILVVGAASLRQYIYEDGPLLPPGAAVAVVSTDPDEVHRSAADLAVLAEPAAVCRALADRLTPRPGDPPRYRTATPVPPPVAGEPMRAPHVFAALAERISPDTVIVEESPSSRPDLERILPARRPMGFVSAAMGGLGFGLPAAAGIRLGAPDRPVIAILGDGSSLYGVQGLWSAARYSCGVLYLVMSNGRYAVMDRLAERTGGKAPWPGFDNISISALAAALGCPARQITTYDELCSVLDEVVPSLANRTEPLLLDVAIIADTTFAP